MCTFFIEPRSAVLRITCRGSKCLSIIIGIKINSVIIFSLVLFQISCCIYFVFAIQSCREASEDFRSIVHASLFTALLLCFFIYFLELASTPEIHFHYMKKKTLYKTNYTKEKRSYWLGWTLGWLNDDSFYFLCELKNSCLFSKGDY